VKAVQLVRERISYTDNSFAEVVVWQVQTPIPGSKHLYKYRLAFVVAGECVLRYDNEAGKGDHRHLRGREVDYTFQSIGQVLVDFNAEVRRFRDENRNT